MKILSILPQSWLTLAAAATFLIAATPPAPADTDFNEVGRQVAYLLKNVHYSKEKFDDKLSEKILNSYLDSLDMGRVYFTQEDEAKFHRKYGKKMADMIVQGRSLPAAEEIYQVFQARVTQRMEQAQTLLNEKEITFDSDESVLRRRQDAERPENEEAAAKLWAKIIKSQVLAEKLRRETISKRAIEKALPDPTSKYEPINEKVLKRLERVAKEHSDTDNEDIANYFLSALTKSFDPHTEYFSHRETEQFMSSMANSLSGIGALLQAEDDGATKIKGIVNDGPADRQGELKLGDRIIAVDPDADGPQPLTDVIFMKLDKVVELIRGEPGTKVRLHVEPATGGEAKFITIERERVEMKEDAAKAELITVQREGGFSSKVGYIKIPAFYADFQDGEKFVSTDVERLLIRLVGEGLDSLILDLRGNGGGSLQEVKRMASFFTGGGPVVQIRNTRGAIKVLEDKGKQLYDGPLVVMTDRTSASASEILAAVLQDEGRAIIVGDDSTFGKGTVQQPFSIAEWMPVMKDSARAGMLKATIQKFYRAAGGSTQLRGVEPDIVIPTLASAYEIGERFTDNPLPYDEIPPAASYNTPKNADQLLHRETLRQLSQERIKEDQDMTYILEDIEQIKERLEENSISLNINTRLAEIEEADQRRKTRNAERMKRYAEQTKLDQQRFSFFQLKLEDLDKPELPIIDFSKEDDEFMLLAKDDTDDLEDKIEFPSRLDPLKRESIHIALDLFDLTAGRQTQAHVRPKK